MSNAIVTPGLYTCHRDCIVPRYRDVHHDGSEDVDVHFFPGDLVTVVSKRYNPLREARYTCFETIYSVMYKDAFIEFLQWDSGFLCYFVRVDLEQ